MLAAAAKLSGTPALPPRGSATGPVPVTVTPFAVAGSCVATVPVAPPTPCACNTPGSETGAPPASRSTLCAPSCSVAGGVSAYQGMTW